MYFNLTKINNQSFMINNINVKPVVKTLINKDKLSSNKLNNYSSIVNKNINNINYDKNINNTNNNNNINNNANYQYVNSCSNKDSKGNNHRLSKLSNNINVIDTIVEPTIDQNKYENVAIDIKNINNKLFDDFDNDFKGHNKNIESKFIYK